MPLEIVRNDITRMEVDAVVCPAEPGKYPDGGAAAAIYKAAGAEFFAESLKLGGCRVGEAKATGAYGMPCRYIIHTVGPVWQGGGFDEDRLLSRCYANCLKLAAELGCESVAFPLISSGLFGFPGDLALRTAVDEVSGFLAGNDMKVYIVVFDKKSFSIGEKLFWDIAAYIDDNYIEENYFADAVGSFRAERRRMPPAPAAPSAVMCESSCREEKSGGIEAFELDEGFSEKLMRLISEKGMTAPECYKKANVDKKLFSKIKNDSGYTPAKTTVLAFAVALRLNLLETRELLDSAGYALSRSKKLDVIVEYFISKGRYNIFEINEALFEFDQVLLGC
ncbi:MAG: macro domain-containing protein [Clostridia bacterium]|nr:macro domain-containing protein [Clostridia bacterium]